MNILFILYHGMECNSAHHVAGLAADLAAHGDDCVVAVPDALFSASREGALESTPEAALREVPYSLLAGRSALFDGGAGPDVIVAWTPRENVRLAVEAALRRWRTRLVVHLEDNEDAVTARYVGRPIESVGRTSGWTLRKVRGLAISHPRRMRGLLARADGVTMVMDRLAEFVPPSTPSVVLWPGYDEALFDVPALDTSPEVRSAILARWGVDEHAVVLVYTGNIHWGNLEDMEALYRTVVELNQRGTPTRLLRTGETHVQGAAKQLAGAAPFVSELGFLPRRELPSLLRTADVLVQPGRPGPFNDYRFPSKLPEYFVSARPVVLARTNIGRFLQNGREAVVVPNGTVAELADAVLHLSADRALAGQIGRNGQAFARRELRWATAASKFRLLLADVMTQPSARLRRE